MAESAVSSGLSTARPLNRNVPVTCWIIYRLCQVVVNHQGLWRIVAWPRILGGCEDRVNLGALRVARDGTV